MRLKLQTIFDSGHILHVDLTGITSNHERLFNAFAEFTTLCSAHGGIGLAANQVGLRENVFFVAARARLLNCPGGHLCINPAWTPHPKGKQYIAEAEGCLSLPKYNDAFRTDKRRFNVSRWDHILAEWTNTQGHVIKRPLRGVAAQVFQHEHDHLRGITLVESGTELK